MPFQIRNLSVLAYANGFTLWHYKSKSETLEFISKPNYFADASDMFGVGDMIMLTGSDGGRILLVTLADEHTVFTSHLS